MRFDIVGNGAYREHVVGLTKGLGLQDSIDFLSRPAQGEAALQISCGRPIFTALEL